MCLYNNHKIFNVKAYHSSFNGSRGTVGNLALLPLKTDFRGPAPKPLKNVKEDIIDETLYYFKSNVFFRTYEIKVNRLWNCVFLPQFNEHIQFLSE